MTNENTTDYIREMLIDLTRLALEIKHTFLVYLLLMAVDDLCESREVATRLAA